MELPFQTLQVNFSGLLSKFVERLETDNTTQIQTDLETLREKLQKTFYGQETSKPATSKLSKPATSKL